MRHIDLTAGLVALLAGVAGAHAAGCVIGNGSKDCSSFPDKTMCGSTGGGTTTTSTTTGPPPPAECGGDPTPPMDTSTKKTGNIRDDCAIFVCADSTAASPDGTMENPYKTLKQALASTTSSKIKVFACKAMPFSEGVTVSSAVELYGGFDCTQSQWTWTATDRTELDGPADTVALTIPMSGDGALVSGWKIVAAKPMAGVSSIAVAVDDVATGVSIQRSDISAADAANGADGTTPTTAVTVGM